MSWYEMHRCVYDYVRSNEGDVARRRAFDIDRYDLSDAERAAFDDADLAAFFELGLHPVLLNRYAREVGHSRDAYREILRPFLIPDDGVGRWQK